MKNESPWKWTMAMVCLGGHGDARRARAPIGCARMLLAAALTAGALLQPPPAAAQRVRVLVQSSPLAGFQYHQAPEVWRALRVGDALRLERETDNAHDSRAVRVEWQGHKLGYVPRAHNAALAWAMDRGEILDARISRLRPHRNPRKRLEFEVYVE